MDCRGPESSTIVGLARSARSEDKSLRFILLDLNSITELAPPKVAELILRIFTKHFIDSTNSNLDFEYAERNGEVLIPRLVHSGSPSQHVRRATSQS